MTEASDSTNSQLSPLIKEALAASAQNDTARATHLLQQACQEEPGSAIPQFLLGAELAQTGKVAEAEAAYSNAVILAPAWPIARFELGSLQFTSGRAAVALVTWQPLLGLPDEDFIKLFVRGYAALAQDSFHEAISLFEAGIDANQTNPPLNGNIQLLINEINKIVSMPPPISPSETEHSVASRSGDDTDTHFLISNYQNSGRPH